MEGDGELQPPAGGEDWDGTRAGKMDRLAIVDDRLLPNDSVLLLTLLFVAGALLALLPAVRALLGLSQLLLLSVES